MRFPLTEDMFLTLDPTDDDREFYRVFIQAVNRWYEEGKEAERSSFYMTANILKAIYKRLYNEEVKEDATISFLDITAEYMNAAWQQGLRDSGKVFEMPLEAIQVYPCFIDHPPKADKIEQKEQYSMETGLLQSPIILDSDNYLIDGYTSYLVAKAHSIRNVPIRYGKRQIVKASHMQGGRLYNWELPEHLIDKVSAGDKVLVHTRHGVRFVTVAAVEPYKPQEYTGTLRKVIKVRKEALHND